MRHMAYFLVITLADQVAEKRELWGNATIGRSPDNAFCIPLAFISAVHCTLISTASEDGQHPCFMLQDGKVLGKRSRNGTWVNGKAISRIKLNHQDVISFAPNMAYPQVQFIDESATNNPVEGTESYEFAEAN